MRWRKKRLLKMSDTISMQERIKQILDLLRREYVVPEWQPHSDPVSVLVQTILSQNTSDTNSRSAFQSFA